MYNTFLDKLCITHIHHICAIKVHKITKSRYAKAETIIRREYYLCCTPPLHLVSRLSGSVKRSPDRGKTKKVNNIGRETERHYFLERSLRRAELRSSEIRVEKDSWEMNKTTSW